MKEFTKEQALTEIKEHEFIMIETKGFGIVEVAKVHALNLIHSFHGGKISLTVCNGQRSSESRFKKGTLVIECAG